MQKFVKGKKLHPQSSSSSHRTGHPPGGGGASEGGKGPSRSGRRYDSSSDDESTLSSKFSAVGLLEARFDFIFCSQGLIKSSVAGRGLSMLSGKGRK